jgi:hypothetical protein
MTKQVLKDIRSCYEATKQMKLKMTASTFCRFSVASLPPAGKAYMYSVLALNKGRLEQALSFIRLGRENIHSAEELAYLLYLEGILQFVGGNHSQAIECHKRCADLCWDSGDQELRCDVLLYLATIYLSLGEPAVAKVYEKEAALLMPRKEHN